MSSLKASKLREAVAGVAGLEKTIESVFKDLIERVAGYPEAVSLLEEVQALATSHRNALMTRLQYLGGEVSIPDRTPGNHPDLFNGSEYLVSAALRKACGWLNQALMEYATLLPFALRGGDGWVVADEGTTGHIARDSTKQYADSVQKLFRMFHQAVVWDMEQVGMECQCTCPSCSTGICLCAAGSRAVLRDAIVEAGPIIIDGGHFVLKPRSGSAAANAGLLCGDVIESVDGKEVHTSFDVQDGVRAHQSGETVLMTVQRGGDSEEISVTRP